jgi:hypothetical protein
MGYRDDFYKVQYIIGYTGDLHDFPTVYFQKGNEFGHITQKHPDSQNVGRMKVEASNSYFIGNEIVEGSLKLVEKIRGRIIHVSRNTLTKVDVFHPANKNTVALLAQSIYNRDRGEKYISHLSKKDDAMLNKTMEAKEAVLAQLRKAT